MLEGLLEHLCRASAAANKDVRLHTCQLLTQLLAQLPASVLSDDTVLDSVAEALTESLVDKLPAVRAEAVRGLCSLIAFFEVGGAQFIHRVVAVHTSPPLPDSLLLRWGACLATFGDLSLSPNPDFFNPLSPLLSETQTIMHQQQKHST